MMGEAQWMFPAPTGNLAQITNHSIELAVRGSRLVNAEATSDELRDLAKLLRALEKEIFQGGQNTQFVSAEAKRIRHPIVYGWYNPLPGLGRREYEQQRLFDKVGGLLGEIASGTADSPRERLKSLASDVDELVAKIDPQSAGDDKNATDISKCPRPTMPSDPTTRDLIIALQEGAACGKKTEQINRDFLSKRTVPKNAVASLKRAARRYLLKLKKWESADT